MKTALCLLAIAVAWPVCAGANSVPHVYPSGFAVALKLGGQLYESLPPDLQKQVHPAPVTLDADDAPMIMPIAVNDDQTVVRQVAVSVGFIDLLNHLAHAKAIDHIEPGYFEKYVVNLSRTDTNALIPEVPNMADDRYWTEDVMSDQLSYFNQMFGLTIAINLSHHYLGHYTRYAPQMPADKPTPINNLLTPKEWEASLRAGALNALDCGFGADGVHALLDAFDKMPKRPAWTSFIVPQTVDLRKLNTQLAKYETDFFHGKFK